VVGANLVALGTQPLFGLLADKIGRKPVFIYGALASAALTPVFLLSLESGSIPLMFLAAIGFFSFGYAASNAVWPLLLRRDVQHQGALLRPGHRHPDRLPDGRFRAGHRLQPWAASSRAAGCRSASSLPPSAWWQQSPALTAKESFKVPTKQLGLK
jgi:hypothetical protein